MRKNRIKVGFTNKNTGVATLMRECDVLVCIDTEKDLDYVRHCLAGSVSIYTTSEFAKDVMDALKTYFPQYSQDGNLFFICVHRNSPRTRVYIDTLLVQLGLIEKKEITENK